MSSFSLRFALFLVSLLSASLLHAQLVPADTTEGRTSLEYENDPFTNYASSDGGSGFVKFAIILSQPGTVYFQDSNLYQFHFDFATQRLQPFLGMSRAQFDAVSLRRAGQKVVLGAVLFPPFGGPREFGIQFVGSDPYPKESVKTWIGTVKTAVLASPAATAIYIPSFEQKEQAEIDRTYFAEQGIEVDGIERWISSDAVYADGWAFGRLVFVPGADIATAYATGTLRPTDVLLTDGVPAEVPFLAGILTLSAATPNSHVAILARNQRVPFAWISSEAEQARVRALAGREVLVRAASQGADPLRISAADEDLAAGVRARILAEKEPPIVQVSPRKHLGKLSANTAGLRPEDIRYFGGKASNFGLLRRVIPQNSPKAIAFSFDLWEQFLANVNPDSGLTLGAEIQQRLGGFTWPPNIGEATAALEEVRDLIRKKVKFTDTQKAAILNELTSAGFAPTRMLRFRSSSNAEDTAEFSGAGLYESFSGCIADSQDNNDEGPCACATGDEPEEKTVLKAIEKVFASFYNDNAWLERLRFGIRERQVGMAVLVHENAPDAEELANGVATITRRPGFTPGQAEYEFTLVTQLGAVSVTNPEGGARPEIVLGGRSGANEPFVYTQQHSDLVQLGGNVMTWESDYRELVALLAKVTRGYAELFPEKKTFTLDLEFKKLKPGILEVKQVRELPPTQQELVSPILLNEPVELTVLQTEFGDVFAYHRLKSVLATSTRNARLSESVLQAPLHRASAFDFILNGVPSHLEGGPLAWPGYRFRAPRPGVQVDSWFAGSAENRVDFRWRTTIPTSVDATVSPVITQRDFTQVLTALYRTPQTYIDFDGERKRRTSDSATLVPRDSLLPDDTVQKRRIEAGGGVVISPEFRWPKYSGFVIIKTFPLASWERTTITGLTSAPLVLTSDFAQTYAPGHHNFTETFLYEPALDPGVSEAQRNQLLAADIRLIHVFHDRDLGGPDAVRIVGFDGEVRSLP